ncbi:MAG: DinB family protein [Bacteroidota bacterium]|nr:DinB family protein [Bacteroidota bacterium]
METIATQEKLFIKMVLAAWNTQNSSLTKWLESLSAEQLSKEIAPGKNTGIYLLGHLIAVSDSMLPILDFGEKLYPQLENVFIKNPDKSGLEKPTVAELKKYLEAVNEKLGSHIQSTTDMEWFERHMAVSEGDFAKEPHRNKLNIIINRTSHLAYHLGQMALLK